MEVGWEAEALDAAAEFMRDDASGLALVFDAADRLSADPRPPGTTGSPTVRRMHVGRYRLVYEIHDGRVMVLHLGRVS
ncbi:MAG: type II toxin-antitoxin system RelE family toxin [Sporichthyaceae bacterium]